ncbi:hypothetical protein E0H46_19425 [Rhizobium leguminosarum bv. viciae]|nr:hypothetical protein E0H46_19425 [Rhizobium leguminosarum bv. viciae]
MNLKAASVIACTMGSLIAAFGVVDAATAAPEQIGCYGDNWGPTLAMLEPTPAGPMTFKTLRCMPIPEGWPRMVPPALSPNGELVYAFGSWKGLWLGDVTRGGRAHTVNEKLPGDLFTLTAPFTWLDDSSSVIGVKRETTVAGSVAYSSLRPYLFRVDGSQAKLPELTHPGGALDELYWIDGSGLALAGFGMYERDDEKEDEHKQTLAFVDANTGAILQAVEKANVPGLADQRSLEAVKSKIDPSGRAHVLVKWGPSKWLLWVQGQSPKIVPLPQTAQWSPFVLSSDASSVLMMGNLSATGWVCELSDRCPQPIPQSGMIAEFRDLPTGLVKWTISGTASYFSRSLHPAVSPDGRWGLISLPDEQGAALALISMTSGKVIQKVRQPGWGPIGLSFSADSKSAFVTGGTIVATYAVAE